MCAPVTNQLPDDIEHFDRLLGYGAPFKWRIAGRARGQGNGRDATPHVSEMSKEVAHSQSLHTMSAHNASTPQIECTLRCGCLCVGRADSGIARACAS